jgi:hypothetical protein
MTRRASRSALLALTVLLLSVGGCEYKQVVIAIPDFLTNEVAGMQLFRLQEGTTNYVPAGRIEFADPVQVKGKWKVPYVMINPDGSEGPELKAAMEGTGADPVVLRLWYARWENPGEFKAKTFNAVGSSPLSDETIDL